MRHGGPRGGSPRRRERRVGPGRRGARGLERRPLARARRAMTRRPRSTSRSISTGASVLSATCARSWRRPSIAEAPPTSIPTPPLRHRPRDDSLDAVEISSASRSISGSSCRATIRCASGSAASTRWSTWSCSPGESFHEPRRGGRGPAMLRPGGSRGDARDGRPRRWSRRLRSPRDASTRRALPARRPRAPHAPAA